MQLERDPDLLAVVEEAAREHGVPGLSVGVLVDGRALVAPYGVTSLLDPLPVDESTLFMIGSTSKTFTATALMALVDAGKVALSDRVVDHLPGFRLLDQQVAETVTVQQLVNHTSGWRGDVHPQTGFGDDALSAALEVLAQAPQDLPPGTLASYSNSGFLLAGHLIATVHGAPFEQAVRELVLTPLGLTESFYFPWDVAHRRAAVGHTVTDGVATTVPLYAMGRSTFPAGGLWSSVRDQLAWARYHLDGTTTGTPPLQDATRRLMQERTVSARSTIDGVGLSWLHNHRGSVRTVEHGGNVSNLQTSTFVLLPDLDVAVTVMANTKHGAAIGGTVLTWVLEKLLGQPAREELPTQAYDAAELVGTYDLGPWAWELTDVDGRLHVQTVLPEGTAPEIRAAFANQPAELVCVGDDVFASAKDRTSPALDVIRTADGAVDGIVHGMRFARRR